MMQHVLKLSLLYSLLVASFVSAADTKVGEFGKWTVFKGQKNGQKCCYMVSFPIEEKGNYTKRGRAYAMITHWPSSNSLHTVSFHQGYSCKKGKDVEVNVGGKKFNLFTEGEVAWAPDGMDLKVTTAIATGSKLTVRGQSGRGTKTTDTYSLSGSGKAWRKINDLCGVRS